MVVDRCYVGDPVKGGFGVRWEIPFCIASCYSVVTGLAARPVNKFALQSGCFGESRISLRDGGGTSDHAIAALVDSWRMREFRYLIRANP